MYLFIIDLYLRIIGWHAIQFLMSLKRIPLAVAVTSNVFGVSESFSSAESDNVEGQFF